VFLDDPAARTVQPGKARLVIQPEAMAAIHTYVEQSIVSTRVSDVLGMGDRRPSMPIARRA
jgi:hypothetical protein